ncbi:MAG: helix-turn-helix transcriptional regulator [Burkholderiales bacterium]|nr:helix-turn-helix transcriptional regulator [Burkholderiales bacterium]
MIPATLPANQTDRQPAPAARSVGDLLRSWRARRRASQLDLATDAGISPRHMSFVETGRSQPSRELVLRLAERLQMPLRERNALLHAAGFAPLYSERSLSDPALGPAREAIDAVLRGHEPNPALAVDRRWTMLAANRAVAPLLKGIAPDLLAPPLNVLKLSLHPAGLAPRIVNYADWRSHLMARLKRDIDLTGDPGIIDLKEELMRYPVPEHARLQKAGSLPASLMVVPLMLDFGGAVLSFLSTITVFGTPVDVTLSEIAIESFFPADAATAQALRQSFPATAN